MDAYGGEGGEKDGEVLERVRRLYRNSLLLFFFFSSLHPQWQKKWIIQPPPLHFIGSENDESFKPCKRFFLRSAREENWHCEKLKWFKDVIPPPRSPPPNSTATTSLISAVFSFCTWALFTKIHTHTHARWRTDKTPRGFDCTTVNFEKNHPRLLHVPSPFHPPEARMNLLLISPVFWLSEWAIFFNACPPLPNPVVWLNRSWRQSVHDFYFLTQWKKLKNK